MIESFAFLAVGFLAGLVVARRATGITIANLQSTLAKRESALKSRMAQLKSSRRSQMLLKSAWNEVAQGLFLSETQRRLLVTLGELLAEMNIPEDANASLEGRSAEFTSKSALIDRLVREAGTIRMRELWHKRSYAALHEMVAALVASAPAANNSDFGALEVIEVGARRA